MQDLFEFHFVYKYRKIILIVFALLTAGLFYHALKVEKSYQYLSILPPKNKVFQEFQEFKNTFHDNANIISVGLHSDSFFSLTFFNNYRKLHKDIVALTGTESALSLVNLSIAYNDIHHAKFNFTQPLDTIFNDQQKLNNIAHQIRQLKIYEGLLFNNNNFLLVIYIKDSVAQSKLRENFIQKVELLTTEFSQANNTQIYLSGLPYIRTKSATLISKELIFLIIVSSVFLLLAIALFYKNWQDVLVSLCVVVIGIIWSLGTIHLFNFKLSLLTAIIPSIIIIIGIPNCIYFLNKYHTYLIRDKNPSIAISHMLTSMGKTTLFCNLTMALGFFVFMFTKSTLLYEFGLVAGLNICFKFIISYCIIPLLLHYLPKNKTIDKSQKLSDKLTKGITKFYPILLKYKKIFFSIGTLLTILSIWGIFKTQALTYVLDDVPSDSKLRSDLKYFEKEFKGIFTLEINIDTKKKNSIFKNISNLETIDKMITEIENYNHTKSLSIISGLKSIKQAYYFQDTNYYELPNNFDANFIIPYINHLNNQSSVNKIVNSFVDSSKQKLRVSIRVADLGSIKMKKYLDTVQSIIERHLEKKEFTYTLTGATKIFLQGNIFIMQGLRESILWSIFLITLCMIYLFRSIKIIFVSLLPNIVPLLICFGIMGFADINLKPATVIIFSIALGIAADITIRYLISFKYIARRHPHLNTQAINLLTLQETFSSIIFTSIALILGFMIFIVSNFESIKALGWLTSLTLFIATIYNLIFLPLLLNIFIYRKKH